MHSLLRSAGVVIKLVPATAESLRGFLLRTAIINGYPDPQWILDLGCTSASCVHEPQDLAVLARVLGVTQDDIYKRVYWCNFDGKARIAGNTVARRFIDAGGRKLCPLCIADYGWIDIRWDISLWAVCPLHGTLLVDACKACGRPVRWRRRTLDRCSCGHFFRDQVKIAPCPAVEVMREITRRFVLEPADHLSHDLNSLLEIIWLVGTHRRDDPGSYRRYITKPTLDTALSVLREHADIVLDWPSGLHRWLARQRIENENHTGIHADHGSILKKIQRGWNPENPAVDEVRRYLRQCPLVIKPWSYFHTKNESQQVMSGAQAAAVLGVSKVGLQELISQGSLDADLRKGGGSDIIYVSRPSVERLLDLLKGSMSYSTLGVKLGLSRYQIKLMYLAKIFEALPRIGKRGWPRFPANTSEILEARVRDISTSNLGTECLLSLADVPALHQESLLHLVQKVFSQEVACRLLEGPKPLFRRIMVDERSLRDDGLGVCSAAAMLGIHERMIPHLISAGCLPVDPRWRRRYRSLSKADLDVFRRDYILTREVADLLGTNTRSVIKLLNDAGIDPVIAHSTASQISAVWRRSDVVSAGLI